MHIVLAILGALAAAFWAFTHFVNAAHEGREAVRDVTGVIRRGKWNRRVDKRLIENLSDPREAAVLLYQMAAYDGAVTDRQAAQIVAGMRDAFEADEETAQGLYAFAAPGREGGLIIICARSRAGRSARSTTPATTCARFCGP